MTRERAIYPKTCGNHANQPILSFIPSPALPFLQKPQQSLCSRNLFFPYFSPPDYPGHQIWGYVIRDGKDQMNRNDGPNLMCYGHNISNCTSVKNGVNSSNFLKTA